jgi:hypothetical protein
MDPVIVGLIASTILSVFKAIYDKLKGKDSSNWWIVALLLGCITIFCGIFARGNQKDGETLTRKAISSTGDSVTSTVDTAIGKARDSINTKSDGSRDSILHGVKKSKDEIIESLSKELKSRQNEKPIIDIYPYNGDNPLITRTVNSDSFGLVIYVKNDGNPAKNIGAKFYYFPKHHGHVKEFIQSPYVKANESVQLVKGEKGEPITTSFTLRNISYEDSVYFYFKIYYSDEAGKSYLPISKVYRFVRSRDNNFTLFGMDTDNLEYRQVKKELC